MLGVKLHYTTVAHPEANSVSERINFSIKATAKALIQDGYNFCMAVKIHETCITAHTIMQSKLLPITSLRQKPH